MVDKNNKGGSITIMIIGIFLAIIFAASTAYSGMKAGLTVAAGIPGSILGAGLIGMFAKSKKIPGKNLVQGMSSGGESIASGMIFVLPAIILIGGKLNFIEGVIIGVAAVLFSLGTTSLVYNYLIIEEHGKLIYPESLAISETLVASDSGGESLKYMGIGFGIGGLLTTVTTSVFGLVNNMISYIGSSFYKWKMETEVNPLLLGIGFIVGLEVSLTMFAGSLLSNFAIAPLVGYFSEMASPTAHVWNNPDILINQMDVNVITGSYVKYIGAGMMLCGGIIGALRLMPIIVTSISATLKSRGKEDENKNQLGIILLGIGTIAAFILGFVITGSFLIGFVGASLAVILSLLFVIVAGRLTGTIGTSNLPVSGMTIASLVIMCLVFLIMGWTASEDSQILLLFAAFVVVAISVAGGYTQSQKVTYIMGGNKNEMQKYFMIASIVGVVVVVGIISMLSNQLIITDNPPFGLPQANLIATLTTGIMSGDLPWVMIIAGIVMAMVFFFFDLPIMTVAIGFYLPIATTSIILIGALIRVAIEKLNTDPQAREDRVSNGISMSSGLIAGGSIVGLLGIILHVSGVLPDRIPTGFAAGNNMGLILLAALVLLTFGTIALSKVTKHDTEK